jgi:hypothetical protein
MKEKKGAMNDLFTIELTLGTVHKKRSALWSLTKIIYKKKIIKERYKKNKMTDQLFSRKSQLNISFVKI